MSVSLKELDLPLLDRDAVMAIKPHIAKQINSLFGCYDLGGYTFTEVENSIYLEVQAKNVTLFIESTTSEAIIARN